MSRRRRVGTALSVLIAMLLMGAIGVQAAWAGTYVMRNCDVPGQPNSPMHPWEALDNGLTEVSMVDACEAGGGVSFTVRDPQQLPVGRNANIIIKRPDGPRSQIQFVKVVLWYAARLTGSGAPINFTTYYFDPEWTATFGVSNPPPGSENLAAEQELAPNTAYYYVGIHCGPLVAGPQPTEPCVAANSVPLLIRGMEVTLSEDIPPTVLRPGGSLLGDGPQSGIRTLTYSASDPQSGLGRVDVLLDDAVVASHDLTPRCPYSDFTVCPASLDESLQVDTRAVPNGPHRLTLRVQDAAGNVRVIDGGHAVDVFNEADLGSTGGPVGASAFTLSAHFKGTSRSTLTVPYGSRVSVSGRLAQGPLPVAPGMAVEVLERPDRKGMPEAARARVTTTTDGSFSVVLSTDRPSRTIRLAYRAAGAELVVSRTLKLLVRAASRLRASLRGRLVHFSGQVFSGPIAKRGKTVLMEGRSPGSAWTQFKRLRTDRSGRFSGTYRLRVRRPGVVLKIRAAVPRESDYGYVSSRSRAVALRVR